MATKCSRALNSSALEKLMNLLALLRRWVLVVACAAAAWQASAQDIKTLDYQLKPRALADGVYVVEGANADFSPQNGCNIINTGFIVTQAGVLVINTGPSRLYGEQLRQAIARVTSKPVVKVLHLNLHPDYFLGNQAFADVDRYATASTRAGIAREAASYEDNLFKLCGDWMKGTQTVPPNQDVAAGTWTLGERRFELRSYQGHTDSDLVLLDVHSGVAFVGGLAFSQRVPTTPHADIPAWQMSLDTLEGDIRRLSGGSLKALVPSHGPVRADLAAIAQTRDYLSWIDATLSRSARQGLEMTEVLSIPIPPAFATWAALDTEYLRNVVHLYPRYETKVLAPRLP
jgi:quinoprotein relay system zinc metallohydrolase 1